MRVRVRVRVEEQVALSKVSVKVRVRVRVRVRVGVRVRLGHVEDRKVHQRVVDHLVEEDLNASERAVIVSVGTNLSI